MNRTSVFRPAIDALDPYVPGIQPEGEGWLKLNTNENPFPPSPRVIEAIRTMTERGLALYPNPTAEPVRVAAAKMYDVDPAMILVGNGGDEILALTAHACLGPGDTAVVGNPTYTLIEVLVAIEEATVIRVPLNDDFALPEAIFGRETELLYLPNPNAPSGVFHPLDDIDRLCEETDGLVVLDEAYADFSDENALVLVHKYSNLLIVRTLSKSYALAGLRVGFAIAQPALINGLMKIKDSYNVNALSQAAAVAAIEDQAYWRQSIERVVEQRERMTDQLRELDFFVVPSQANYVFARPRGVSAQAVYEALVTRRILVRHFDRPRVRDFLRITIGRAEQNDRLLEALRDVMNTLNRDTTL